jgi:hypothetical protein
MFFEENFIIFNEKDRKLMLLIRTMGILSRVYLSDSRERIPLVRVSLLVNQSHIL